MRKNTATARLAGEILAAAADPETRRHSVEILTTIHANRSSTADEALGLLEPIIDAAENPAVGAAVIMDLAAMLIAMLPAEGPLTPAIIQQWALAGQR